MVAVIFDIDGTLADLSHRLHYISNGRKDWKNFFNEVSKDTAIMPLIKLVSFIDDARQNEPGPYIKIFIVSGRPEHTRNDTEKWLKENGITYDELFMRPDEDYRKDTEIKRQILNYIRGLGHEIWFVVDDRPSVVAMWREEGLTCLQCRDWVEKYVIPKGNLILMVGPSGAGKTVWIENEYECLPNDIIVSSDGLRQQLCGDFKDQTKNDQIFKALHAIVKTRIDHGLDTIVDATNIRNKDRLSVVTLGDPFKTTYVVIDRPIEEKRRDGGWRNEIVGINGKFDLIGKHDQVFKSNLKDILAGDNIEGIKVLDKRTNK